MDPLIFSLAAMCSIGLGGVALSFAAILKSSSSTQLMERRAKARHAELEAAFEAAKETVSCLETKLHQIEEQTPVPAPASARSGFNLSKRSQALRMHRRGDNSNQIAAALQIPVQEVELLLKVHRIVLDNLVVNARHELPLEQMPSA